MQATEGAPAPCAQETHPIIHDWLWTIVVVNVQSIDNVGGVRMTATLDEALREALVAAQMTPEELRLELALALYQHGTLPFGKARQLAGVSAWGFQEMLGRCTTTSRSTRRTWPPCVSAVGGERREQCLPAQQSGPPRLSGAAPRAGERAASTARCLARSGLGRGGGSLAQPRSLRRPGFSAGRWPTGR